MSLRVRIALIAVASLVTLQLSAQNPGNPIQVALLRWYQANTAVTFNTGCSPAGLAFDGAHMWVACGGANELKEFNASDGKLLTTVTNVFSSPYGANALVLMYDGANIWVANGSTATGAGAIARVNVSSVNASGMSVISCAALSIPCSNFPTNSGPWGMTFDGASVYVANYQSNNLSKIASNASNGTMPVTVNLTSCTTPLGLAFDITYVWVACSGSANVQQLNSNGSYRHSVSVGPSAFNLAFDGANMWVTCNNSSIYKITNYLGQQFAVGSDPYGIAFDGKYIWVSNANDDNVSKVVPSTGMQVPGSPFAVGSAPGVVAFDGGNIWVVNTNSMTLSKF